MLIISSAAIYNFVYINVIFKKTVKTTLYSTLYNLFYYINSIIIQNYSNLIFLRFFIAI